MGHVYFFRHLQTDTVKIGHTTDDDTKNRFQAFSTYSPYGAKNLGSIEVFNPVKLEKELHEYYKDYKTNGEFFDINEDEVARIIENYSFSNQNEIFLLDINIGFYHLISQDIKGIIPKIIHHYSQGDISKISILTVNSSQSTAETIQSIARDMEPVNDGLWYESKNISK